MERKGMLIVLSGPSGAGKGTVLQRVLNELDGLALSVSVTTREPRVGEIDGIHYYFKTKDEFEQMVENGEFLEYVKKFKNMYGTLRSVVEKSTDHGIDVVLEIETKGASRIRKTFPKAVSIFITPSNYKELDERLRTRNSETEKARALRLEIAKKEYNCMNKYDYVAINDDLDECIDTVKAIIKAERSKTKRYVDLKIVD